MRGCSATTKPLGNFPIGAIVVCFALALSTAVIPAARLLGEGETAAHAAVCGVGQAALMSQTAVADLRRASAPAAGVPGLVARTNLLKLKPVRGQPKAASKGQERPDPEDATQLAMQGTFCAQPQAHHDKQRPYD